MKKHANYFAGKLFALPEISKKKLITFTSMFIHIEMNASRFFVLFLFTSALIKIPIRMQN